MATKSKTQKIDLDAMSDKELEQLIGRVHKIQDERNPVVTTVVPKTVLKELYAEAENMIDKYYDEIADLRIPLDVAVTNLEVDDIDSREVYYGDYVVNGQKKNACIEDINYAKIPAVAKLFDLYDTEKNAFKEKVKGIAKEYGVDFDELWDEIGM